VRLLSTWSAGNAGQSAQTVPVDVGAERDEAEAAFMRTMTKRGIQVEVEVLRRQKAEMWNLSAVKRQSILVCEAGVDNVHAMQRFDQCCLFHGTDPNTAHTIISQGFKRSFCGNKITRYGNGVHFARDASYSSRRTYATADTQGVQCMFLCRVVVGVYCRGIQNALTPAVRNDNMLFDTIVDDMANPSIHVTYHDAQAYPEYLSHFRQCAAKLINHIRDTRVNDMANPSKYVTYHDAQTHPNNLPIPVNYLYDSGSERG